MKTLLVATAVLTSFLAGIFLAYSLSVNPALHSLSDHTYVETMQRINKVIQNPLFFLVFMGPVILLPLTAYLSYKTGVSRQFYTLAGASLLYIILTFGVTVGGNVPLNNKLAAVPVASASAADLHKARTDFEGPWNGLHAVRTVAGIAASVLAITACILPAIDAKD